MERRPKKEDEERKKKGGWKREGSKKMQEIMAEIYKGGPQSIAWTRKEDMKDIKQGNKEVER